MIWQPMICKGIILFRKYVWNDINSAVSFQILKRKDTIKDMIQKTATNKKITKNNIPQSKSLMMDIFIVVSLKDKLIYNLRIKNIDYHIYVALSDSNLVCFTNY